MAVHAAFPGVETRWVSDIEPGPCKILAHRYPDVPNLGDITQIDWAQVERVDILAGGSPCQDLSTAGRRAGMREGTRSGLWENMRHAIDILKPTYVVWENVLGALSATATSFSEVESDTGPLGDGATGFTNRALGRLLGDLTEGGYDAQWTTIRASDVGACHHRDRVFLLAVRRGVPADALRGRARRRSGEPGQSESERANGQVELPDPSPSGRTVDLPRSNPQVLPTITTQDTDSPAPSRLKRNTIPLDTLVATLPTPNTMDTLPARTGEAREKALRRGGETSRRESTGNLREEIAHLPTVDTNGDNRRSSNFGNGGNNFHDIAKDNQWGKYAEAIRACGNGVVPQQGATALTWLLSVAASNTDRRTTNGMVPRR